MTTRTADFSPRHAARIAGILYLTIIAGGVFAQVFVRQEVVVIGDAAATAQNILDHELLYRLGFAVHLFYIACAIPLALILYRLFTPVNANVALLALAFNLVAITIEGTVLLNHFAPLRLISADGSGALGVEQAQALSYAFVRLFGTGFGISLTFFGFFGLTAGYLIFRSSFLPRILGILMAVAGLCYLTNSFSVFVAPALSDLLFPYILLPCLAAELSLASWLAVMGVNADKWNATASRLQYGDSSI